MDQSELLQHTVKAFRKAGIPYAITGSQASSAYGENRFTNDIDVVADITGVKLADFLASFPPEDFYVSEEAARQAVAAKGQFNIIEPTSAQKVDVILPATEFDRLALARARTLPIAGEEVSFTSPEDIIVKKLDFYREGGSEKHLRDITGILRITGDQIDRVYVDRWSTELGLDAIWQAVQRRIAKA